MNRGPMCFLIFLLALITGGLSYVFAEMYTTLPFNLKFGFGFMIYLFVGAGASSLVALMELKGLAKAP